MKFKTAKELLFSGNEGNDFRTLINNLDESDIIETIEQYAAQKQCNNCKFFNIKTDEHGICDNLKNEFPLRFNASNKGYEMLKPEVKLLDFEAEIKPYTTFYIHQDFGCVNHCA